MIRGNIKIEKRGSVLQLPFSIFQFGDADQPLKILPNLAMKKQT